MTCDRDLFVPLSTARLALEPVREEHASAMQDVLADASLYRYMLSEVPPNLTWLQARYRALASGWSPDGNERWLNWIVLRNRAPVGYVQATAPTGGAFATMGWTIGTAAQGRGLGREAVQAVCGHLLDAGIAELRATIDARNTRSISLAECLGFRCVRTRLSDDVLDGAQWLDHDYVLRIAPSRG